MSYSNHSPSHGTQALTFWGVLLVLSLWLHPAEASLPLNKPIIGIVRQSDTIVVGTLGRIQDGKAQFSVDQILKGGDVTPVIEVAPIRDRPRNSGDYHFQEGETLMLFLKRGAPFTVLNNGWGFLTINPATRNDTVAAVQHLLTIRMWDEDALMRAMLALATSDNALLRYQAHNYISNAAVMRPQKQLLLYEKEFITLLKHPDSDVRIAALQGLRPLRSSEALPLIIEMLRGQDTSVVEAASRALAPYNTVESVAALVTLTRHADPKMRIRALAALDLSQSPEIENIFIAALDDPDPQVRAFAPFRLARSLRRGETAKVIPRLILMLNDPYPAAQVRAADALGESASVMAVEPLFSVLGRKELSEEFEDKTVSALKRIYSRLDVSSRPPAGNNLPRIAAVMERGRRGAGLEAVGLLAQIATPEALDTLHWTGKHHALPEIRKYAEQVLPLLIIEKRLRKIILKEYPETVIDLVGLELRMYYRSKKYRTHITEDYGNSSKQPADQFPADFSEFILSLRVKEDLMYYRPNQFPNLRSETFGGTLSQRYNLKEIPVVDSSDQYPDVPLDHWAYNAIYTLSEAGIIEGYPSGQYNGSRAMTRYEFAVAIARLIQRIQPGGGPAGPPGPAGVAGPVGPQGPPGPLDLVRRPELQDALNALRNEFRTELAALGVRDVLGVGADSENPFVHGQTWQPRYEHLALSVSYGKGMNPALLTKIQQVIEDCVAATVKSNLAVASVPTKQ